MSKAKVMTEAVIYLRNGHVISFECDKLTVGKSAVTGGLTEIRWEGAVGAPLYIDLTDVVAVTTR